MKTLETVAVLAAAFVAFWVWQNWPAISFALRNPQLVSAGSDLASGLSGLGVFS